MLLPVVAALLYVVSPYLIRRWMPGFTIFLFGPYYVAAIWFIFSFVIGRFVICWGTRSWRISWGFGCGLIATMIWVLFAFFLVGLVSKRGQQRQETFPLRNISAP